MTTIVFVENKQKNRVDIAFDSKVSAGWGHDELEQPKVFQVGQVYIGVAGAVSAANNIEDMHLPNYEDNMSPQETDRWVQKVLIPAFRRAGMATSPWGQYQFEGQALVAVNKRVYSIGGDYSRVRNTSGNYAIGSGGDFAKAALDSGASAKRAVEIAAQNDLFTGHSIKTLTC